MTPPVPDLSRRAVLTGGRLALFADTLILGVLTAIAALGLLTAFPALVAACTVLRDRVAQDRRVGVRTYAATLLSVLRGGPAGILVPVPVVALLALDAVALAAGAPGAAWLIVPLVASASAVVVLALRAAAGWRSGLRWTVVVRRAARAALADPGGSALLWLAGVAGAAVAVTVPITVLLVAGPLAMAAVAVDSRSPRLMTGAVDEGVPCVDSPSGRPGQCQP